MCRPRLPRAEGTFRFDMTHALKKNAISFASNVVIGVASTAPAYSLAAALPALVAAAKFGVPAIVILAFVPMLFIAVAYYHLNHADPDCGTTFSWATRAIGPYSGWMGGWVILATDILVMPGLAQIAGTYSCHLFGFDQPSVLCGDRDRRRLDRGHDRDLLSRHRALRAHAKSPARRRGRHPPHLRRGRIGEGLFGPGRRHPHRAGLVQPVHRRQRERFHPGHAGRGVHLLGLGHRRRGERGDRRSAPRAGARRRAGDRPAGRPLRDRRRRRGGLRRARARKIQRRRLPRPAGDRRARLRHRQAVDLRGADLGRGLHPDHDPAGRRAPRSPWRAWARCRNNSARSTRAT